MGGFCHTAPSAFLFITLISALLSLCLQPHHSFSDFPFFYSSSVPNKAIEE